MCSKGYCFYCIPVENGCLVLAVLSAIVTGLTLLATIIVGLLTVSGVIFAAHEINSGIVQISHGSWEYSSVGTDFRAENQAAVAFAGLAAGVIIIIVLIPSLIGFIFSVLLCNGICKRRPGQVKAYFIYGVVITVLAVIASVIQLCVSVEPAAGLLGLLGCVIYALFLVLVHQTYSKLLDGTVLKDHIRLVEG